MKHVNAAVCPACDAKLAGVHADLVAFAHSFRATNPDGHISCGMRGKDEQEADFDKGVSKAHWMQSAHNFGAALDYFRLTQAGGASFDSPWFTTVLAPAAKAANLVWGGSFTTIRDLPHVELANWKALAGKPSTPA